jgi:hypothetical protein
MRIAVVVVVLVLARSVHAAWYYTWTCTGNCAPGELASTGTSQGYDTEGECDGARASDPVNQLIMQSGNLGSISYCHESDGPPDAAGAAHRHVPTQRKAFGLVGGPGWRLHDTDTMKTSTGAFTTGGYARIVGGGRPVFGLALGLGAEVTRIQAAKAGPDAQVMLFAPATLGIIVAPRITENVRVEFGVDADVIFGLVCNACQSAMGSVDFHGGLEIYGHGERGIELEVVYHDLGDSYDNMMLPPPFEVRLSLAHRNLDLFW